MLFYFHAQIEKILSGGPALDRGVCVGGGGDKMLITISKPIPWGGGGGGGGGAELWENPVAN